MTNSQSNHALDDSLIVVDAGGTKTAAWLVTRANSSQEAVVGRGRSGAGNPLSVGFPGSSTAISEAIAMAYAHAGRKPGRAARAVLSIAGSANERLREQFFDWAQHAQFAQQVAIVSDVLPVLAAGSANCQGVAVISGTGSVAFGRAANGKTVLRGGWGYLLGDEGSGYSVGRAALQHTLLTLEMGLPRTALTDAVLCALGVEKPLEVTRTIYGSEHSRVAIAAIAPQVIALADGDDADSQAIMDAAAVDLSRLVARTVQSIEPVESPVALAAAGGVLLSSSRLRNQLHVSLRKLGLECEISVVDEPLKGCVRLAAPEFANTLVAWQ